MSKYLELIEGSFTQEHLNKQKNQNPYVAYSIEEDRVIYTIVSKEEKPEIDLTIPYVIFKAEEANSTIGLAKLSSYQTLEYSTDTTTWSNMNTSTTITLANAGDEVYIRGVLSADNSTSTYTQFKMNGKIAASGNCSALWDYENLDAPLKEYCGYYLFRDCPLTTAPELPTTTLILCCYDSMFYGCTSLTTAPSILPATTLANYCYSSMFYSCTSLTTAPVLPATMLTKGCYEYMFYNCTSLTTAPVLPATTLAESCYQYMFHSCSNLNYIKCLATDKSASKCTQYWVYEVAAEGEFVKDPNMTGWGIGRNGIPYGWKGTEVDISPSDYVTFTAEVDNSTIGLKNRVSNHTLYWSRNTTDWYSMYLDDIKVNTGDKVYVAGKLSSKNNTSNYTQFEMTGKIAASGNCSALWDYENLDAPLKEYCGYYMFYNCTSLTTAPELPATTLAWGCYRSMFQGCTSLTTAPELPATTLTTYCYQDMFNGCTSLTTAPELPATTLTANCYQNMFRDCTSLTTAPELLANKLTGGCYGGMFYNCSKLNYIKCLATDKGVGNTSGWVGGVASSGTFVQKRSAYAGWSTGTSGIPEGWEVIDYAG